MIKLKSAHFLTSSLIVILFPAFLGAAEIPPYQKYTGPIKPGLVITKENFDTYLPEIQKLVPPTRFKWISMGLKAGLGTIPVVKTTYSPLTRGQLEATRKYAGTARVGADNQLYDWKAGVPFPEPKTALEILWNCNPTISRATSHDELMFYAWFGLFKETKYEKNFSWNIHVNRCRARTDMPPLGDLPDFTERGVSSKEAMIILQPNELKGFIQLRIRYWDINKLDECYAYIPAIRRLRRLTGGDMTDPLAGSPLIPDDHECWRQKLDSRMKVRVLEHRDFLVGKTFVGLGNKPVWDYKTNKTFIPAEMEIRPLYVLEIMINNPEYVYSKRIVYVDAVPVDQGGSYLLYWGEMYDQKGRLYKANGYPALAANKDGFKNLFNSIIIDYQTDNYAAVDGIPAYVKDFDTVHPLREELFTVRGLLKKVH